MHVGGCGSPDVACWASDHWVAGLNPLIINFTSLSPGLAWSNLPRQYTPRRPKTTTYTRYKIQDTRYKIQDTRYKIQDTRYKIQDTRSLFPNPMTCILLCVNVCTEYYYDYNGNGRSTITHIGCLPGAPGKVICYIRGF